MSRRKRNTFAPLLCLTLLLAVTAAPLGAQPSMAGGEASPWALLKTLVDTIWEAVNQGPLMDPSGMTVLDDGPLADPSGDPFANDGPLMDPSGEPVLNDGPLMDPAG